MRDVTVSADLPMTKHLWDVDGISKAARTKIIITQLI